MEDLSGGSVFLFAQVVMGWETDVFLESHGSCVGFIVSSEMPSSCASPNVEASLLLRVVIIIARAAGIPSTES